MKIYLNDIKFDGEIVQKEYDCEKDCGVFHTRQYGSYQDICYDFNVDSERRHTEYYDSGLISGFFSSKPLSLEKLIELCDIESKSRFNDAVTSFHGEQKRRDDYYEVLFKIGNKL